MATATLSVSAEALYQCHVWPALWDVLQLHSPAASSPSAAVVSSGKQQEQQQSHLRSCRTLQHTVTHVLLQILNNGAAEPKATLSTLEGVSSQLLLHRCDVPPTKARGAAAAVAIEVERFCVLVCTAIQLSAQTDVRLLSSDRVSATIATGPATATAMTQLSLGVTLASTAVVAGIYGVAHNLEFAPAASSTLAPNVEHHVQPLWFTFLFTYLQQLSAHTPKDTTPFARFFENCGKQYAKRIATDPISSDEDDTVDTLSNGNRNKIIGCDTCKHHGAQANELAALRAWSQVSPDLLKDTIARTRFRRAALLFKSFVPHITTQAPTLMFLLVDLLCEYSRTWEAWIQSIPQGHLGAPLAERLAQYSTDSIAHDSITSTLSSFKLTSPQQEQQWHHCQSLIQSYGDRLTLLLGEGTPHAHLVATALCSVLLSLYILPHTGSSRESTVDVSSLNSAAVPPSSPTASKTAQIGVPAATRGKWDEEAAVLEVETTYHLPRRSVPSDFAMERTSTAVDPHGSTYDETCMSEAEWRLRHYAPFGQLLAYVHILELQKVHLFSVVATQMRVGRTAAQQAEHVRLFSMASLYCGVSDWDLALLIYHFSDIPLNSFVSSESSPPLALPSAALARYTAAVQQYVDQSRAELIVSTPFVEMHGSRLDGGVGGDYRNGGARGGGGGRRPALQQNVGGGSTIPSRGELQTPRFIQMVSPDPVLLSWRAHLAVAELTLFPLPTATDTAQQSSPFSSPTPQTASPTFTSTAHLPGKDAGHTDAMISPCCFIRDLLVAGQYTLATMGMGYLSEDPFSSESSGGSSVRMNVLLPPRRGFPRNISVVYYVSVVLRRWLQRWETLQEQQSQQSSSSSANGIRLQEEMVAVLHSLLPLLSVVQSYLAHQALLTRLVARLAWLCKTTSAYSFAPSSTTEKEDAMTVFALVEQMLICVIMPCLRVLPPALSVYDALDDITEVLTRFSSPHPVSHAVIPYGDSPATPLHVMRWLEALLPSSYVSMYRTKLQQQQQQEDKAKDLSRHLLAPALVYPHDALLRKEREAFLSQSLKRLNAENIEEYQAALRPILYAEPLLVAHRLFVQAVGYNNNFLDVHTHLLHGLPRTILTLITQQGLLLMERYAAEEKVIDTNGESRTAILATFLATLWRVNVDVLDGTMLVRRVEFALRSNSSHDILLGTELLKALLTVMAHRTLEHEEKYSVAQLQALAVAPSTTSFFGRGAMTSFRVRFWQDSSCALMLLSPTDVLVRTHRALTGALQQHCVVPLENEDDADEEEVQESAKNSSKNTTASNVETQLTLGQFILIHLCRLQSRIYELQRDLDGSAELILLSSAERFNTMNDMLFILEEMFPAPKDSSVVDRLCMLVRQVALPQVSRYVETQLRRKLEMISSVVSRTPSPLSTADAVYLVPIPFFTPDNSPRTTAVTETSSAPIEGSLCVARLLQYFTAAHFEFTAVPYDLARQEWQQCIERAQRLLSNHRVSSSFSASAAAFPRSDDDARARRAEAIIAWLKTEETRIEAEERAHHHLLQSSAPARAALFEALVHDIVPTDPTDATSVAAADDALIDFAMSYLLPRAVLNLREAATVAAFFTWAFQQAESSVVSRQLLLRRTTDLALTFVSAAFTYFVAYTDGESKRIGYVLQRLLEIPALSSQQQQKQSVAELSPQFFAQLHQLFETSNPSDGGAAGNAKGDKKAGSGTAAAANGESSTSPPGQGNDSGASATRAHSIISSARYSHLFLNFPAVSSYQNSGEVISFSSSSQSPLPSILALAIARGLVVAETETAKDITSTSIHKTENEPVGTSTEASTLVDPEKNANSSRGDPHLPSSMSAIPLQFEAYVCQALVQLLTHDDDVPAYAQRNQFLLLEQLDKTSFPSTLCAVDLLIRAVEPHASKSKSYYALASAVLKHLRVNRRRRREAQHIIVALSRGENVNNAMSGGIGSPTSTAAASTLMVPESLKESATACHAQWRMREHYMKQLMQAEVARLLSDKQIFHHDGSDVEEEEEEKASDDSELPPKEEKQKPQQRSQDDEEESRQLNEDKEDEEGDSSGEDASFDEEDDVESDGKDGGSEGDEDEEESSGSYSDASDEEGKREASPPEEGDDDIAGGPRKRPREE